MNLVTFTEELLNGKLHLLCSARALQGMAISKIFAQDVNTFHVARAVHIESGSPKKVR